LLFFPLTAEKNLPQTLFTKFVIFSLKKVGKSGLGFFKKNSYQFKSHLFLLEFEGNPEYKARQ